jgi:cytochrome c oxidase cbb3-type subunit I/II
VHSGTLGWNAFLSFGILYWVVPRLWRTELFSKSMATFHFWIGTIGLILYQVSMWVGGITQWAMWRAFEPDGRMSYPDFIETVVTLVPMYWVRLVGGLFFFAGLLMLVYNLVRTMRTAPKDYKVDEEGQGPAREPLPVVAPGAVTPANTWDFALYRAQHALSAGFHRLLERRIVAFSLLVTIILFIGTLVEIIPMTFDDANVPKIASVKPYTPLELLGRDMYIREGCYVCHSQMVRPFRHETERYGEYSKAGEFVYDHPFQFGSKRTGPDLQRVGGKYPHLWHVRHFDEPPSTTPGSLMPAYSFFLDAKLDVDLIEAKMSALRALNVPYTDADIEGARESIKRQAAAIAHEAEAQRGPSGLEDKEVVAITAFLQRLGTDIRWRERERGGPPPIDLAAVAPPPVESQSDGGGN